MSNRPTPRAVLRTAVTPRWLGFAGLALIFIIGAVVLGRWQWERTQDIIQAEQAAQSAPRPVEEVSEPDGTLANELIGQPVFAEGNYEATGQVMVLHRSFNEQPGVWVVTPLRLTDGSLIAVLRGWLPEVSAPGAIAPDARVVVAGVVQPDEGFYLEAKPAPGTVVAISSVELRKLWGPKTRPGYVTLATQQPTLTPAPTPVPPTVVTDNVAFPIQNFFYAIQWLIFAAFAIVVYGRWLWRDAQEIGAEDDQIPTTVTPS
ncbi:MAG: SURF1 family protein [Actinomycetota bacterium]|nr:SURF1 family protein [Actinomycetota bacterium]